MIDREHKLSVVRQAKLLGFSRGSVYYSPRPVPDSDLALMRRIDELHLDYPFAGSRMLQGLLRGEGLEAGRLHVATLMKKMGIEAIYRRPNTSKPAPGHKIYPYLLRKLAVRRLHPAQGVLHCTFSSDRAPPACAPLRRSARGLYRQHTSIDVIKGTSSGERQARSSRQLPARHPLAAQKADGATQPCLPRQALPSSGISPGLRGSS